MELPVEPINNTSNNFIIDSINTLFSFFKNIFKKVVNLFKGSKTKSNEKINRDFFMEDDMLAEEILHNEFINDPHNNHRNPFTKKIFRENLGNFPENMEEGQRTLLRVKERSFRDTNN